MSDVRRTDEEIMQNVSLSLKQINYMTHAIGLEYNDIKKEKYKAYRNYFYTRKEDREWEYLVMWGLALRIDTGGDILYNVTKLGCKFLERIYWIKIDLE